MALEYLVAVVGSRGLIEDRIHSHVDILTENGSEQEETNKRKHTRVNEDMNVDKRMRLQGDTSSCLTDVVSQCLCVLVPSSVS